MDRSQLTPEEYGAQFTDPFPAGAELSKDDIIARWQDRYERLKASSARQVSELSDEVLRLSARVSLLESLLDEHGISEYDALPLEDGLAVLMGGVRPPKGAAASTMQAVSVVSPAPELRLGSAPLALATGLHTMQNVIAVASLGRVRELEDMPVLLLSGGADKKAVASWLDTTSGSITVVGSVSLAAPVLDIAPHPSNELGSSDVAIGAAALMDGSVAIVAVSVDLATAVPIDARPPVRVSTITTAKDHSKFAVRVKWSPDGTLLAVCSQDHGVTTYAFNIEEPSVLKKLATTQFTGAVEAVEFVVVRDSPIVPGSLSEALFLVCAVRGSSTLFYINSITGAVSRVGISEDSALPLTAGAAGLAADADFTRVGFTILDLAVSPDGKYLAAATDHGLHFLYQPGTSIIHKRLCGHSVNDMSSVRLAWHPTSAYLASTSDKDNSVYVWDVATQAIVDKVCKHTSRVRSVVCWHDVRSGPSAYFVSASFDKSVMVWTAPWVPLPTMHDE